MRNIFLLITFVFFTSQIKGQTINWVGQSKYFIEKQCSDANFTLFSDKENEQKFEVTSNGDMSIFLVFYYKNGYCECQTIVGKCNENDSVKLENIMRKHFCENSHEIDEKHLKCGQTLANLKKSYGNGTFVYILWWLETGN